MSVRRGVGGGRPEQEGMNATEVATRMRTEVAARMRTEALAGMVEQSRETPERVAAAMLAAATPQTLALLADRRPWRFSWFTGAGEPLWRAWVCGWLAATCAAAGVRGVGVGPHGRPSEIVLRLWLADACGGLKWHPSGRGFQLKSCHRGVLPRLWEGKPGYQLRQAFESVEAEEPEEEDGRRGGKRVTYLVHPCFRRQDPWASCAVAETLGEALAPWREAIDPSGDAAWARELRMAAGWVCGGGGGDAAALMLDGRDGAREAYAGLEAAGAAVLGLPWPRPLPSGATKEARGRTRQLSLAFGDPTAQLAEHCHGPPADEPRVETFPPDAPPCHRRLEEGDVHDLAPLVAIGRALANSEADLRRRMDRRDAKTNCHRKLEHQDGPVRRRDCDNMQCTKVALMLMWRLAAACPPARGFALAYIHAALASKGRARVSAFHGGARMQVHEVETYVILGPPLSREAETAIRFADVVAWSTVALHSVGWRDRVPWDGSGQNPARIALPTTLVNRSIARLLRARRYGEGGGGAGSPYAAHVEGRDDGDSTGDEEEEDDISDRGDPACTVSATDQGPSDAAPSQARGPALGKRKRAAADEHGLREEEAQSVRRRLEWSCDDGDETAVPCGGGAGAMPLGGSARRETAALDASGWRDGCAAGARELMWERDDEPLDPRLLLPLHLGGATWSEQRWSGRGHEGATDWGREEAVDFGCLAGVH